MGVKSTNFGFETRPLQPPMDVIPAENKRLRACMLCSLVKTAQQFRSDGCDNCEESLHMRGSTDRVIEYTSASFSGCIAMMQPSDSWVAKWQRISNYQKGVYAIRVNGRLPEDVVADLEDRGISYRPRDSEFE